MYRFHIVISRFGRKINLKKKINNKILIIQYVSFVIKIIKFMKSENGSTTISRYEYPQE